jgi:predicted small lipoprotein YifL
MNILFWFAVIMLILLCLTACGFMGERTGK